MAKFKDGDTVEALIDIEIDLPETDNFIIKKGDKFNLNKFLAENWNNGQFAVKDSCGLVDEKDFKLIESEYTNQEMIDRIEKAKSINDFVEEKVAASETQVAGNHYSKLKIQPMEYCLQNNLNYGQSNAIKYITRYKDKNGIEDLKKAIHCIELLIEFEEKDID